MPLSRRVVPKGIPQLYLIFVVAFLFLFFSSPTDTHSAQVTLAWNPNPEPDIAGYKIHYGTSSGSYTSHVDVGNHTTSTVSGLQDATKYYFAATTYNNGGLESSYSAEVVYNPPAPSCTYSISPTTRAHPASGGTGGVNVTSSSRLRLDSSQQRFLGPHHLQQLRLGDRYGELLRLGQYRNRIENRDFDDSRSDLYGDPVGGELHLLHFPNRPILHLHRRNGHSHCDCLQWLLLERIQWSNLGYDHFRLQRHRQRHVHLFSGCQLGRLISYRYIDDCRKDIQHNAVRGELHLLHFPNQPVIQLHWRNGNSQHYHTQRLFLERLEPCKLDHDHFREHRQRQRNLRLFGRRPHGKIVPHGLINHSWENLYRNAIGGSGRDGSICGEFRRTSVHPI